MRRALAVVALVLGIVAILGATTVWVLTNTDIGRERVRRLALGVLNKAAHGHVFIGRLDGNLLREIIVSDGSITDSSGAPFIAARRIAVRYSLRDLFHKRLVFRVARIDHPVVVLHEYAPGAWNFKRIFPSHPNGEPSAPGFGSWIVAADIRVTDGRFVLQREQVMTADSITAWVPQLRIADPAQPVRFAQVASLRTNLTLFTPLPARVRDLTANVYLADDSLWFTNTRVTLPDSHVEGASGHVVFDGPQLDIVGEAAPVALADIRFAYPRLPSEGWARGHAHAVWRGKDGQDQDYRMNDLQVVTGTAHVTGAVGIHVGDAFAFRDTHVKFSGVDTRLAEQLVPNLHIPREGVVAGTAALDGSVENMHADVDVAFADQRTRTTSHLTVTGAGGIAGDAQHHVFRADNVVVTLDSVRVALARTLMPSLPIGGTLTGRVHVDGATNTRLAADADLVHTARTGTSHFTVTANALFAGRPTHHPLVDINATADPLSLVTAGRFAPALGLQGVATGNATVTGDLGDLTVHGRLRLTADTGGADSVGILALDGHVDLASPAPNYGYDINARAQLLDVHAVVTRAPVTTLTASLSASGRGTSLSTMHSTVAANVQTSIIDSVSIESAVLRGGVADGVAHLDSARIAIKNASVDLAGTFGLVAGRTGTLTYRVAIDSLSALQRFLPPVDTTRAEPNERGYIAAIQRARGDTATTGPPPPTIRQQVERAVGGVPLTDVVPTATHIAPVDTVPIRHDALLGHIVAAGVVRGSLTGFELRGRAAAYDIVAHGAAVRRARAEYAWLGAPNRTSPIIVGAQFDTVAYGRWALDSIDIRTVYHQPNGSVVLLVRQRGIPSVPDGPPTHDQEYTVNSDIRMLPGEETMFLQSLALRFDTTFWSAPQPATIRWDSTGLTIENFALRNGGDGHVIADGTIPRQGEAMFHIDVAEFQVGDLAALIESHLLMQGMLTVNANIGGITTAPTIQGKAALTEAAYDGHLVPNVSADFDYNAKVLDAHARVWRNTGVQATRFVQSFAHVDAHLPINLGTVDSTESRLPDDGPVDITFVADSTPLELIPEFVSSVQDVKGLGKANLHWTGTLKQPEISGTMSLDSGSVFIVPLGIALTDITLRLRGTHDSITIDSMIARSQGTIRVTGNIDITDPSVPVLNVFEQARRARVINTKERGWLFVDDSLTITGPLSAPYAYGHVHVTEGVLYVPNAGEPTPLDITDPAVYAIADTSISSVRNLIPTPNTIMRNLLMDVDVQVDPSVWVRNKDANIEVYTDGDVIVRSDRRHHAIVLDGQVNSDRGQYTFLTKRFEIAKGTATFIGTRDFDPSVQATAVYGVQPPAGPPFNIKILISGTATQPTIALTSDVQPPLSQSDLINYLAFGSSSTSLLSQANTVGGTNVAPSSSALATTANSQALQEKLATLALGTATQQFQGDFARILNADVFNITTGDTPISTFNNATVNQFLYGTEFEFGKYFTPNMYVAFQARASNWGQAPPGAVIQSRVARNLTLEAAYQPIFLLQVPSLTTNQVNPTKVFGLFVIKDWRF
jgi:translocation and assembly module TamB